MDRVFQSVIASVLFGVARKNLWSTVWLFELSCIAVSDPDMGVLHSVKCPGAHKPSFSKIFRGGLLPGMVERANELRLDVQLKSNTIQQNSIAHRDGFSHPFEIRFLTVDHLSQESHI